MKLNHILPFVFTIVCRAAPASSSSISVDVTVTKYVDSSSTAYDWSEDWIKNFPIHKSCNDSQFNQLSNALEETQILAAHARDHTARFGNLSKFYQKYFGDAPSGEVVGWFENIVNSDKSNTLFRCDDIDDNCKLDGWAGHWRGENASNENVICDLSYTSRLYLSQMCSQGYTVSKSKNSLFWAGDLLHRIWHTDSIGQGVVGHYADTYDECLKLAKTNTTEAVRNSATLRYYALDVYAYDIAVPGKGCTGDENKDSEDNSSSTTDASKSSSEAEEGTECHTHSNGETHCS
ncbi:uncharacterized protein AC631_04337 [Debaryomyces fabryi]|uniref:Putative peptidase domain-containing protein n=1 Tax=Debaryomyces fabryi TaxID=58627 RepID=A0A0V1PUK9_9ASCO|nr:uncharacterized protein AC631_04337 [Debaryomyces fabryi]KRZ99893.1 hypothetical protein AC631_04337 [Debaryomyces fabryi]CUM57475.1 unnamed protein product [Debaryomyces fabryi]